MTTTEVLKPDQLGGLTLLPVSDRPTYFNMLVYGDPGVGKTVLAGSAEAVEDLSPVIYLDIEGGTLSLRNFTPTVQVVRIKSFEDLAKVFDELRQGKHDFKTVVMDSLTEAQKFGMYSIMKRMLIDDPDRDPDLPGIGEWGKNTEQIRRLVRAFRDLPMNTIFVALAQTDTDKKNRQKTKPALSQKLSNEVAGFLDVVCYMYRKEIEDENSETGKSLVRCLLTEGQDDTIAKDRTDRLPPVLVNPDMSTIYRIMFQEEN